MALAPAFLAELVDAAALLFVLLGWAIALGLLWTWRHTLGAAFLQLADALNVNIGYGGFSVGHIDFGGPIRAFNTYVENFLSAWALGADIAAGRLFAGLAWIFQEMASGTAWVARELYHSAAWIVESYLPALFKAQLAPLLDVAGVVRWAVHHFGEAEAFVKHAIGIAFRGIEAGYRWAHSEIDRLERWAIGIDRLVKQLVRHEGHAAAQAAAIPAIGAVPIPIGRTITDLKRLARKHEGLFAAGIMAGVMANVLGLSDWRCLTRGNIGRLSRALCGIPSSLLNDLLGLLADFTILENFCLVIPWLEEGVNAVAVPLAEGLTTVSALNKDCIGRTTPSLGPLTLYLPATVDDVLAGV